MRGSVIQSDICVIGCGPAGITMSRELISAGLRVVMLESGERNDSLLAQELRNGRAEGPVLKDNRTYLVDSRRFQVGGSGGNWGTGPRIWCAAFNPIDFASRSWVPCSGWPFDYESFKVYMDHAAENMGIAPFSSPVLLDRMPNSLVAHAYHYPVDSGVFRRDFEVLCSQTAFHVELGTTAMSFEHRGGQINVVKARRSDGEEIWVEADRYVLAAGGIENARILMIQNSLSKQSVLAETDALGRYFMEHFHVYAGVIRFPDRGIWEDFLAPKIDSSRGGRMRILGFGETSQLRERLLNTSIQLVPTPPDAIADKEKGAFGMMVRAEQAPDACSRIVLSEDHDSLGRPRAGLAWEVRDENWQSLVRAVSLASYELSQRHQGIAKIAIHHDRPWPWAPVGPASSAWPTWGNHHMGTTRMHDNPAFGVVDRNCRVHGTKNLFIAGSSTFPTAGFANPTFTIVALAIRLAKHIARQA